MSSIKLSSAALENRALADYNAYLGDTVIAHRVLVETAGTVHYRTLSKEAKVRVMPTARERVLNFACRDLISPAWSVELVEPHPEIPAAATLSVHAKSYHADGHVHRGDVFARSNDLVSRGALSVFNATFNAALQAAMTVIGGGRRLRHQ
ncbi:hypothetical protein [Burkholderia sp. Ac-20365]|uniref:hypothetical protein n=1 Tax=Burkholderia sp. Ac-20365 TaxID=2703897 RepID=UPI00197BA960|nr:hypothetical protein [Burkholderia sp. Ac-20365]MBN3760926.1 hypothetical protein [Burkholderia sp. Ac-20365]